MCWCLPNKQFNNTVENVTDLMQAVSVVDFPGLIKVSHQVAPSLFIASLNCIKSEN